MGNIQSTFEFDSINLKPRHSPDRNCQKSLMWKMAKSESEFNRNEMLTLNNFFFFHIGNLISSLTIALTFRKRLKSNVLPDSVILKRTVSYLFSQIFLFSV